MLQHQIKLLDPQTLAPADEFVLIDDLSIHYQREGAGNGDPVLLIHGFGGWTKDWAKTIPVLAQQHEVYALDLPGWGLSDKPADFDYSIEGQARFVIEFMNHFGLDRVKVVGNSMGGGISIFLATEFPERIEKLVLIDSVGYRHFPSQALVRRLVQLPIIERVIHAFLPDFARFRYKTRWLFGDADKVSLADYQRHYLPLQTPGTAAALMTMVQTLYLDSIRDRIEQVQQPTLILWGENDPFMPVEHAPLFHAAIENSQLTIFSDAGHVPQAEVPDQMNPLLLEFLRDSN